MIGHQDLYERINPMLKNGWSIGASLFHGPPSVGKRTAAFEVAQGILCVGTGFIRECSCKSCGLFKDSNHPDFLCVGRSEGIKVADVDTIFPFAEVAPFISKKKVVVLDNVERMSTEASNRLLKIMEEPPAHVVFFLITADSERVMPTIRSRCIPFRFGSLSRMELTDIFWKKMGFDLPKATTLGRIACGTPTDVFSDPGSCLRNRDMAMGLMQAIKAKDPLDALDFIDRIGKGDYTTFVNMLMLVLADLIDIKRGVQDIINIDIKKDLAKISENVNSKALALMSGFIIQSKRGERLNANMSMALKSAVLKSHPFILIGEDQPT